MQIVTFKNKKRKTYRHEYYDGYTKPLRQLIIEIIKKTRVKSHFYIVFDLEERLIVEQLLLTHLIGKYSEKDIENFLNNCILSSLREKTSEPLITATFIPKNKLALFCSSGIKAIVK